MDRKLYCSRNHITVEEFSPTLLCKIVLIQEIGKGSKCVITSRSSKDFTISATGLKSLAPESLGELQKRNNYGHISNNSYCVMV